MSENIGDDSKSSKLIEDMMKDLECPLCLEVFSPPIVLCATGHSFCLKCKELLSPNKCPQCAADMTNTRCYALETIMKYFSYACKNQESGCDIKLKYADMEAHEKICTFRPVTCTFDAYSLCKKVVPFGKFLNHLTSDHNCLKDNKDWCLASLLPNDRESLMFRTNIIEKFNEIFLMKMSTPNSKDFCVSIVYFGEPSDTNAFKCDIIIGHPEHEAKRQRFQVLRIESFRKVEADPNYFSVKLPLDQILAYGGLVQGHVHLYVTCEISRNPQ